MSKISLNRAPYYNDFDPTRNYTAVLYRAGFPVQARELNYAQSIQQGQTKSFADHIFKNGSRVTGARASFMDAQYVRLRDLTPDTTSSISVETFVEGTTIVGEVSGIRATIQKAIDPTDVDPATLYVIYQTTAIDGETTTFVPGENILFQDESDITVYKATVRCPSCPGSTEGVEVWPTGRGHIFAIEDGTFYFEGQFITNERQQIVVSKYSYPREGVTSTFAGAKIGFDVIQRIVTPEDDQSLLDPSLGYPNATAPGAHRYQFELSLTARDLSAEDGESFLLLGKMDSSYVVNFLKSDAEYADLMDALAKRTYETNGNYTIRPFKISFLEELKIDASDARGYSLTGSESNVVAVLTPAVAYVRGYRTETISDTIVPVRKARDTSKSASFIKRFDQRASVLLRPTNQVVWPGADSEVGVIGDTVINIYEGLAASGAIIGTMRINDVEYVSGLPTDTTAVYRYSIGDLKITAVGKTMSDAKSFVNLTTGFIANAETTDGVFDLSNANSKTLVFPIERTDVKSLRDADNSINGSMSIVVRRKLKATLDSSGVATFSTSTNEFFEPVAAGTICHTRSPANVVKSFRLSGTNSTTTANTFTVNFGATYAGHTVTVITSVLRTNQTEKTKALQDFTYTSNTTTLNVVGSEEFIGRADAYDITKIELYNHVNPATPVLIADVTDHYKLSNGQTDTYYGESKVTLTRNFSGLTIDGNTRVHVTYRYFEHSGTAGFFTVDSYAGVINDPGNDIGYPDIPTFTSSSGETIALTRALDFRPIRLASATTTGTVPASGTTAIFDVEVYLPRSDIIQINKDGEIYVKYGIPSDKPLPPNADSDAMVLYQVFLNAYTYSTADVRIKFVENKRYTMRDIGRLESRIGNLEYYVSLNLLEKTAAEMSVKGSDGLDRFKNGFIADNFADLQAADVGNLEFKAGVDRTRRELRPRFKASNFILEPVAALAVNVQWANHIATLPFVSEIQSSNPYATKNISINPYFQYNKKGTLALSPNVDTWSDETRLPDVVTDIDAGMEAMREIADAAGMLGTDWGTWVNQNTTILGASDSVHFSMRRDSNGRLSWKNTQTVSQTVSTTDTRTGTETALESRIQSYTIDDIVKDVQVIPFVRSQVVEFYGTRLLPNTRVYAYFDGANVSEFCRDIGFGLNSDNSGSRLDQVAYGASMFTDENGEIAGEFLIPGGRFFTGKTTFKLSNDSTGNFDPDMESTSAETTYFSGGLDVTRQNSTLNIETPLLTQEQVSETVSAVTTTSSSTVIAQGDPVAQQFFVDEDQMLTGIDIYLQAVDMGNGNVWVEIRPMSNGYPAPGALARKEYTPDQLQPFISEDSTKAFHVNFEVPVFVQGGGEYCFVVGGWSPNTRLWVAKLGGDVVDMPGKIVETQPTLGSSFRSQNNSTWNAEQFETIKYVMYRARFSGSSMALPFQNKAHDGVRLLPVNPIETQSGSDFVRVFVPDHGMTTGDRFMLSLYEDDPLLIEATDLPPQIGQRLHSISGEGIIKTIEATGIANQYTVTFEKMSGRFLSAENFTADAFTKSVRDSALIAAIGGTNGASVTINAAYGTILEDSSNAAYPGGVINGLPVLELNDEHTVVGVDSVDSLIIQVTTPASASQRSGGTEIYARGINDRYELFNISGSYLPYNSGEDWVLNSTYYGRVSGPFEGQDNAQTPDISFLPGRDFPLSQPMKIAGRDNEVRVFGSTGQRSAEIIATFTSENPLLSPVIDTSTFSLTGVANRVDFIAADTFNVVPNASARFVAETDPLNGTSIYKYVSAGVTLANPAADLMIYLDCYKDQNADYEVYVKKITPYGDATFDSSPWLLVNFTDKKNSQTVDDWVEIELRCSELVTGWRDGNDDDITFTGFKIKIVGKSKNPAKPPLFGSLRAIAVT